MTGASYLTLGEFITETCERNASREAIAFEATHMTYAELGAMVRTYGRALLAAGAGKGTRVALLMGNRPEWIAAAYAVGMVGGVLVPINTYYEPPEIEYVLQHSDTSVLLLQAGLRGHDFQGPLSQMNVPYLRTTFCLGDASWAEFIAGAHNVTEAHLDAGAAHVSPFDDAMIIYTSGTTARPKGVLHAHRAATVQSLRFLEQLRLDETVRSWSAFPFFWTAGFCMVMGATLAAGACLVLQESFEPGDALRLIETEHVTSPHAWPHQLAAMEDHPDWVTRDLSSLRHVEVFSSFGRHKTVRVDDAWSPRAAYGLTETFTIVTSLPGGHAARNSQGNHGVVLPGSEVRIIDGEICVRGTTLMKGYYKVAPEDCFDGEGFFHTGDAGEFDSRGCLHWTGRVTDLIKTGGANVSPVEIENELLRHPDLKAAAAVGVPHDTLGEMVVVCAVLHDSADAAVVDQANIQEFLRGRIASYKIPRRVVFFDEQELDLTGTGKVRADQLRALVRARL